MEIVLVGAGRLATNLGRALKEKGHHVLAVYSRTITSAETLATQIDALPTDDLSCLPSKADAFIVAVKDAALAKVIPMLCRGREDQVFLHTAGSMPLSVFQGFAHHYGVFYPMQSFSKERQVDFSVIPLFLESSDEKTDLLSHQLAQSISQHVFDLSSEDRKHLHLAAVFACNFANHCYALSAKVLEKHGLPFNVMLPLIDETAEKVHKLHPKEAQTGPAIRWDENVLAAQKALLAEEPEMQQIYEIMSKSIHKLSND